MIGGDFVIEAWHPPTGAEVVRVLTPVLARAVVPSAIPVLMVGPGLEVPPQLLSSVVFSVNDFWWVQIAETDGIVGDISWSDLAQKFQKPNTPPDYDQYGPPYVHISATRLEEGRLIATALAAAIAECLESTAVSLRLDQSYSAAELRDLIELEPRANTLREAAERVKERLADL